ncbi:MAG: Fe-S cluster assembly protein SufD [Crocinitomix sp.]|nr:Fe-S cluster assembly protein SufD [Crocinitomix sp.]
MTLVLSEKMDAFLSELDVPSNDIQSNVIERVKGMDFPTTRDEYWKYTRVGKISNTKFTNTSTTSADIDVQSHLISDNYIIIENGKIRSDISQINNDFEVNYTSATAVNHLVNINDNDVFTALNAGLFDQAITIKIAANQTIEKPLQLVFLSTGERVMANNRILIDSGKSSAAALVVSTISQGANSCFNNTITEVNVAENAHLTIHKIQNESASNLSISTEQVKQAKNSTFKINTFTLTGLLIRNNINIAVAGENCETYMNGAIVSSGKQHVDNHTYVDHQVPNCYSNENYKYIMDDHSTGVFNGRVIVQKDAQVINAYQNNGNILLSDNASINSKPELEIYADDVKCSHGSTTGQLDESALFYLQTRGISLANAKKLLVSAFIGEVIRSTENEAVTQLIERLLQTEYGWDFS